MKTKGINTTEQIDEQRRKFGYGSDEYNELKLKSMINSCFCYDSLSITDKYIVRAGIELSEEVFQEVYKEQSEFLKENYTVSRGVYTDNEGCVYNSLVPKN